MKEETCRACQNVQTVYLTTRDDGPDFYGIDYVFKCKLTEEIVAEICDKFELPF